MTSHQKKQSGRLIRAQQMANTNFAIVDQELAISGHRLSDLATQFDTPYFAYDATRIRQSLGALRDATHGKVDVYYSVKANPNPSIIAVLASEGAGAEIASGAEFEFARQAGMPANRIVFAGPGKSDREIAHVLSNGIAEIHAEAEDELTRIARIAAALKTTAHVSIRVNPTEGAQGGSMRMGGKPAQFGIDEERLPNVLRTFDQDPNLAIDGVHLFAGTQVLQADVLLTQWRHGLQVAANMANILQRPLKTIDLGGGLGIPYFENESELDLSAVYAGFPEVMKIKESNPLLASAQLIVEPGRFLVGPAGVYVTRVVSVKESRGTLFAVVDGGMHHHLAASGNLGQVIKRDYPIISGNKASLPHTEAVTVVGPLCTPLDTLGRKTSLPPLSTGDFIVILQSGAYGLTASPVGFLSQPGPAEILLERNATHLIRKSGSFCNPIPAAEPPLS